jgi:hypothetical protein
MTIGMIAGGYDTAAWAQQKYFDDYAANGRLLGRANLFIYTLPTSPMAEIAIPLWLNGPLIHVQDEASPVEGLLGHAREMIADSEAGGMLVLWADHEAAVCIAVGPEEMESRCGRVPQSMEAGPLELANRFREVARTEL